MFFISKTNKHIRITDLTLYRNTNIINLSKRNNLKVFKMEMTISFDGVLLNIVLEDTASQKNVFGYTSIGESIAFALGSTVERIMGDKNHPDFMKFIKARNIVISDVWGW